MAGRPPKSHIKRAFIASKKKQKVYRTKRVKDAVYKHPQGLLEFGDEGSHLDVCKDEDVISAMNLFTGVIWEFHPYYNKMRLVYPTGEIKWAKLNVRAFRNTPKAWSKIIKDRKIWKKVSQTSPFYMPDNEHVRLMITGKRVCKSTNNVTLASPYDYAKDLYPSWPRLFGMLEDPEKAAATEKQYGDDS